MYIVTRILTGIFIVAVLLFGYGSGSAQINLDEYQKYLNERKGMTYENLIREYPAGLFRSASPTDLNAANYFGDIDAKYNLTSYERQLASKYGFMVTERLSFPTYRQAYYDIYIKDLPVYISADAILHTIHRSFDNMLVDIEEGVLIPMMDEALEKMIVQLANTSYDSSELVQLAVRDADLYITMARKLLMGAENVNPIFGSNLDKTMLILTKIDQLQMSSVLLFAKTPRTIDFSQFKPRGHYTRTEELKKYFQLMMWLGRSEIYITKPVGADPEPTNEDIRRQCMLSIILSDLAARSGAAQLLNNVDGIITKFVGEQDNLSSDELSRVISNRGITSPEQLNDDPTWRAFQDEVVAVGGDQKILSQLLYGNPFKTDVIKPAAAYMLMGQRFILDSYILGNVVFDKVKDRMMPSPLDAMFVLGNDAAIQLLRYELTKYDYALNLAGLRHLTSSLEDSYWKNSLYTTWLSAIRAINPPRERESLPAYMQTGAWWQKSLNAQLTSWAELRHDFLLYAKQSYTGGLGCFYPGGYVEPVPALYQTVSRFAEDFDRLIESILGMVTNGSVRVRLKSMQEAMSMVNGVNRTLESMARKELNGESFSEDERALIDNWIVNKGEFGGCVLTYNGYYSRLMYGVSPEANSDKPDFMIADVHTQPTDEAGNMVGKVLHVGTGKINLALIATNDPSDNCMTAFIGPVGSYYEYTTQNFVRLTDEEWVALYESQPDRPLWVNRYIANRSGSSGGEQWNLLTGVDEQLTSTTSIDVVIAPNPTTSSSVIAFNVPPSQSGKYTEVSVVDATGQAVATIMSSPLDAGNYLTSWNGDSFSGASVASGMYYIRVQVGNVITSKPVQLVR